MEWINYHHLLYFWSVVRAGSIQRASTELRISPSAISMQLRTLEQSLGEKLLARAGRGLVLTETGKTVFSYAEEIFTLGRELMDVVKNRPIGRPLKVDIGIVDVLPKMIAQWLIEPVFHLGRPVRIVCREATSDQLMARLATLELDVVLSDSPADPNLKVRAYSHLLGECSVSFAATPPLSALLGKSFPSCLHGAPMLLPTDNTRLRRNLEYWFESKGIRPKIVGEFEDSALLREFGQVGAGVFPVPSIFEKQLRLQQRVRVLGKAAVVRTQFYAISGERKIQHPAVAAMCEVARRRLF